MEQLKTVVVGAGRIGWRFHIPAVINHRGFELVAVVDPLPERLDEVRERFGSHLHAYRDYEELWLRETPDLVVIASPTHVHADQTMRAFEHGADVFCDKPMTMNLSQSDEVIAKIRETGRRFMVYQPHRVLPEVTALREIMKSGKIGDVFMIKRAMTHFRRRHDWQALSRFGGGMLYNYGAHAVDALLYLSGSTARSVNAHLRTVASLGDAEDVVKMVIETENRIILDIDVNMACPHDQFPWQVFGSKGSAVVDSGRGAVQVTYYREDELQEVALHDELAAPNRSYDSGESIPWIEERVELDAIPSVDYYDHCHAHFARGEEPFVAVEETREVMRILEACRDDASSETP